MRRRLICGNFNIDTVEPSNSQSADICVYSKQTKELLIVNGDTFDKNILTKYTPVGVVVIPGSHDVYGDGSCGVMSLVDMNYNTPDTGGTTKQYMYWGDEYTNTTLTDYPTVECCGKNGVVGNFRYGTVNDAYLPSDNFTKLKNPYDTDTWYYYDKTEDNYIESTYIASPFNEDDTRNPLYYTVNAWGSYKNAMIDFDGKGNTDILTSLATAQSNWKTASTITNSGGSGYYPAACCCWRYHTEGTKQGDWYLPACGELGYIMPKLKKINNILNEIGVSLDMSSNYISSTEYDTWNYRALYIGDGLIYSYGKSYNSLCRAFLRIN